MFQAIQNKSVRRVVGLMSGTSVDGIDAAVVEISGSPEHPQVKLLAFENRPFPEKVREKIFALFQPETSTVEKLGYMNFLLGELYAKSALSAIKKAGLTPSDIEAIGSHGQTVWHQPDLCMADGYPVHYSVQLGEGSVIAERTGIPTVSDFRTADMAAGGQGAPLVPFSEYLLYSRTDETILLQNIGGIGNMTVLPAGAGPDEIFAFDTGPGNMIIDSVTTAITNGSQRYDAGGALASQGTVNEELLTLLKNEPYYSHALPKSTGRELFGAQYTTRILNWQRSHGISNADLLATVTDLTAWSIEDAYIRYVLPKYPASELIVGGGGSYNHTLLGFLSRRFSPHGVAVKTQEDLGLNSDAKEAIAFAVMADRCLLGLPNTLPSVTGAKHPVIGGKISLPSRNRLSVTWS